MIVRCIDNTLERNVLVVGREYEVYAERDDCYIISGFDKRFSKTRFEIGSDGQRQPQGRGDQLRCASARLTGIEEQPGFTRRLRRLLYQSGTMIRRSVTSLTLA